MVRDKQLKYGTHVFYLLFNIYMAIRNNAAGVFQVDLVYLVSYW